ncbi:hypothetical protein PbJCM13498_31240 [Prolixibacter bellariivorans]|uniref:Glycoside hydrolase family 5 domain-containing protein n=1 Tax=Prolixibacter bellariivorans TaxID=314319 RepID=A0A5M4B2T8_9BACT|nr:cellulase family glycosylhydrolase [Prolixibacter bellariivorans]GET34261.1 hypothetical protein PbJCM13498_31240 [Prolixibacter bellariivorans]
MKKLLLFSLLILFAAALVFNSCAEKKETVPATQTLPWLHTQGHNFVDDAGNKVFFRGVGLGNWMLPEGYMWKFGKNGDRPRKIEQLVSDMIGPEKAAKFWKTYHQNYIAEADIKQIAELGFNSVRPALNSRLFLTEGENPEFVDEGFHLLDSLVSWCGKYGLYVIIDMHGAPGGQTGANIDDSADNQPELFMDKKNQDWLVKLWVKIAKRYKDNPTVAAYDLLNEPLPENTGAAEKYKAQLVPLYKRITKAIRKVDQKHMITVEGYNWANNWSEFTEKFDDNMFFQFHYYCWNRPDHLNSIQKFLDKRKELDAPVWVGETGEQGKAIYWGTTQYFEANNIGWSFWPWKKMDTENTPYSINKPENWDLISAYSRGEEKPSAEVAQKALDGLLQNIKLANCVYFPDVVNSIFRRIPVKIEAENYGHEGYNVSYFVKDTTQQSKYYRTNEPVPVEVMDWDKTQRVSQQCIRLNQDEWTAYTVKSAEDGNHPVSIRVEAEQLPASFTVTLNGVAKEIAVQQTDWNEIDLGELSFRKGENQIRLKVDQGIVRFDWMDVR